MKTLILVLALSTITLTSKGFADESEPSFSCSYSDRTQTQKDLSLIFSITSQVPEVKVKLSEILTEMGYPQFTGPRKISKLLICKNDPFKKDDFELIREGLLNRLQALK